MAAKSQISFETQQEWTTLGDLSAANDDGGGRSDRERSARRRH